MRQEPQTSHTQAEADRPCGGVVVRILVVTARTADYQHLTTLLRGDVWVLKHASNLALANKLMEKHNFVCTISDEFLTDGSWHGLLPKVHEIASAPKLIVSTAATNRQLWAEALNLGAHDVLVKPFDPAEVLYVAQQAWRAWEKHRMR